MTDPRFPLFLVLTTALAAGCGGEPTCPAGSEPMGGRCVAVDASMGDGAVEGDADLPDAGPMPDDDAGSPDSCVPTTFHADADGDGRGDPESSMEACGAPEGYVEDATDCDDDCETCWTDAPELCDEIDNDCDGELDEDVEDLTWYEDADGDGHGKPDTTLVDCARPTGYVADGDDCDDACDTCFPGSTETCDGADNDCDSDTDEGVLVTYYRDDDGDGYGVDDSTMVACTRPTGYAAMGMDCNDGVDTIYPGAAEACNGLDDDCDGVLDDGLTANLFYRDADGDGYGDSTLTRSACAAPAGYVAPDDDCDDGDDTIHPGATESCNGIDDDCDTGIDENLIGPIGSEVEMLKGMVAEDQVSIVPFSGGYVAGFAMGSPKLAHYLVLDSSGMPMGSPQPVFAGAIDPQVGVQLAPIGTTSFIAVWRRAMGGSADEIRARKITPGGSAGPIVTVASNASTDVAGPAVAVFDSRVLVAWRNTSGYVQGRTFSGSLGAPTSPAILRGTPTAYHDPVLLRVSGTPEYALLAYVLDTGEAYVDRVGISPFVAENDPVQLDDGSSTVVALSGAVLPSATGRSPGAAFTAALASRDISVTRVTPGELGSSIAVDGRAVLIGSDLAEPQSVATAAGGGSYDAVAGGEFSGYWVEHWNVSAGGASGSAQAVGSHNYIPWLDATRRTATAGAIVYMAWQDADPSLYLRRVGCTP